MIWYLYLCYRLIIEKYVRVVFLLLDDTFYSAADGAMFLRKQALQHL